MTNDAELLRRYARERSDPAFAEFVQRHVDLVYGSALRRVGGNEHLAVEVVQHVFTMAARRAGSLARHKVLAAWLYATTRNAALNLRRTEHRRRAREHEAAAMSELFAPAAPETDWDRLRPVLDQVMDELGERDRAAVLLRFFESRSFAEVGERLQLTENAARMRVERALDKMQTLLARHGVTSTAAALGLTMTSQIVVAAPGGLAASVSGVALAAGSGGITGQLLSFMGTTKITGGIVGIAVILAMSLGTNAYLYLRASKGDVSPSLPASVLPSRVVPNPPSDSLAEWMNGDLAGMRDQLRAAGASDASIRATLEGILRRQYREKLSQNRAGRLRDAWWLDPDRTSGTGVPGSQRLTDDASLLREMVTDPLETLLGPDPLDVAEADARYAFLPAELRQALGRLDRQRPSGVTATGDPEIDSARRVDFEGRGRAVEEERQKLLASLTPEQRSAYDMHFSSFATGLSRQLAKFPVTEGEFEKVFPLAENYKKEIAALPPGSTGGSEERRALELRMAENLVAAVGQERAIDFIWVSAIDYAAYARVVRDARLPDGTVGRTLQLASDTGWQAAAIHADTLLSLEQKRAALAALQQRVRPQLDALLPPEVQQRLAPTVLSWLTLLGRGSYKLTDAVLPGETNLTMIASTISLEAKAPNRPPSKLGALFREGK